MLLLALLFVLASVGITFLIPSARVAAVTSLIGAGMLWFFIARSIYHSPIPPNEPEWWAGLAVVSTLTGIGVLIGVFMRRRKTRPLPHT